MKRITFVTSNLLGGGAERVLVNLANLLCSNFQVDVISLSNEATSANKKLLKTEYIALNYKKINIFNVYFYAIALIKKTKDLKILVSSMELVPTYTASIAARILGIPFVAWVHTDIGANMYFRKWHVFWLNYAAYSFAAKIIFVSKGAMDSFLNMYPKFKNKCCVIYNYVSVNKPIQVKTSPFINQYFLTLGRLDYNKGHDNVVRAFSRFAEFNQDLILVVAGAGPYDEALKKLVEDLHLEKSVIFTGFVQNPETLITNSSALILGSRLEGMPTVLVEAMYLNTPVISFACPSGPAELLKERLPNALIDNQDIDKLALAMRKVIDNPKDFLLEDTNSLQEFVPSNVLFSWVNIFSKL